MATNGLLSSKMAHKTKNVFNQDIKSYCKKSERNMRAKKPLKVFVQD
jgi:hypothetical protein